ncbi:efflux RND transporter periplasmic adaptor subunit [Bacillus sp. BGMRC 2118]|nr:efflux RND transporter periplasmic adaptor subunit [Bacillus sp. BGMRC 2118]
MKKWIWSSVILFILCVTIGNIYLMNKYDDKIYRVVSVGEFGEMKKGDLRNVVTKDGVVTANKVESVAYNQEFGLLDEILVDEGEQITVGSSLFQYATTDIEQVEKQINRKISLAEAEQSKISRDLSALRSYRGTTQDNQTTEAKEAAEANQRIINSEISELELRDELLDLDIEEYENQLEQLEKEEASMVVQSTINGIVKSINPSNPSELITILEFPYVVQGVLSEKEIKDITVGQKVYVSNDGLQLVGTISEVSQFPVETPNLKQKESYFPFSVTVTEEPELLPFGHHLDMDIVQEESEDTTYIHTSTVFRTGKDKGKVYIENKGKIKKVNVALGMQSSSKVEILDGLEGKELLVLNPSIDMKTGTPIVLPLEGTKMHGKQLDEIGKRQMASTIGKAMLGIN